jgi:hypothetical protein
MGSKLSVAIGAEEAPRYHKRRIHRQAESVACQQVIKEANMNGRAKSPSQSVTTQLPRFLLGMLFTSVLLDILSLTANSGVYATISLSILPVAIGSALVVATLRLREWSSTPQDEPEWSLTLWRALSTVLIVILIGSSWSLRPVYASGFGSVPVLLSLLAISVALFPACVGASLFDPPQALPEGEPDRQSGKQ